MIKAMWLAATTLELVEHGQGRPLLFLHAGEGLAPERPWLELLFHSFRVIAPWHPGYGDSPPIDGSGSVDDLAYLYLDLASELGCRECSTRRRLFRRLVAACWSLGIVILALLAPPSLLLRGGPKDIGLVPDGIETTTPGSVPRHNVVDSRWAAIDWTLARALGTARFWWIALSYFCGTFVWYVVQVHQTKYLIEIGVSPSAAAWALGAVGLVAVPSQIALGHLSDRIGRNGYGRSATAASSCAALP